MRAGLLFIASLILTPFATAFGQNWINPAGGSWQNAANWQGNAIAQSPTFDLNSAAGYAVTLAAGANGEPMTVQNDNVSVDLDGNLVTATALNVATVAGQNGSLTFVGPGTIQSIVPSGGAGTVNVGASGATGQLTLNDVTLNQDGDGSGGFNVSNLEAENGTAINLEAHSAGNYSIGNAAFSDATLQVESIGPNSVPLDLNINQADLSDNSKVSTEGNLILGGGTIDDSSITCQISASLAGMLTISDGGDVGSAGDMYSGGTVNILPTGELSAGTAELAGTVSVELNSQASNPITAQIITLDSGTLDITLQPGFEPTIGEQFPIMTWIPSDTGTFGTLNLPTLPVGEEWNTSQLYTTGILSVVVPEPLSVGILAIGLAAFSLRRPRRSGNPNLRL